MGKGRQERQADEGKRDFIVLNTKGWLGGTIRLLPPLRRCMWIDLLAMSREGRFPGYVAMGKEGGKLVGWPVKRLASKLGYNYQAFKQALDEFVRQDRIAMDEGKAIRIVNWDKYQFIPSYRSERSDEAGVKTGDGITPGSPPPSSPPSSLFESQRPENRQDDSPDTIPEQNKPQQAGALEDWDEDVEDEKGAVCSADIRRAVRYIRSPQCGLTWYKANLSASLIRSRAREMVDSVPEGWGLPGPSRRKPVAGSGCDSCGETGWKRDGVPCPGCSAPHGAPARPLAPPGPKPAPPPLVAQRQSTCPVCKERVRPGERIRGVGDGNGRTAYAHKWCAPTLDDIREFVGDVIAKAEAKGGRIVVRWGEDTPLHRWPEAMVPLLEKAPENMVFDERWRPWFPGLPDSRFVPEGHAEEEAA